MTWWARSGKNLPVLIALATLFVACSREPERPMQPAVAPAPPPLVLLRGNGLEPDSLDPQKARSVEAQTILRDLYECLTFFDKDASVAPGVAREWNVTPAGRQG